MAFKRLEQLRAARPPERLVNEMLERAVAELRRAAFERALAIEPYHEQ